MYLANEKDTSLKGLVKNYNYNSTTEKWDPLKDIFHNGSASTTIAMNYNGTVVAVGPPYGTVVAVGPPYHQKTDMSTRFDVIAARPVMLLQEFDISTWNYRNSIVHGELDSNFMS